MFYNLRYYSAIVLAVCVFLVVIFALYANRYNQRVVIHDMSAQYASTHFQYFQDAVWERYFPIINFIAKDDKRDPSIIPSYMVFEKEMDQLFSKPEVVVAEFFNNGKLLYSSSKSSKPLDESDVVDAIAAVGGNQDGEIVKKNIFGAKNTYLYKSSYYPILSDLPEIYDEFANNLQPQLIVYYDVDAKIKKSRFIIYTACFMFLTALFGMFAYLYLYSLKIEKILEKGGVNTIGGGEAQAGGIASEYSVKTQFFSNLNHELRTPLNSIIGFSELIKNESMGPIENEQYKEFVNNIHESGVHLLALIDDVQDFAQAGENKLELQMQELDLTKMIKLCIGMLESKFMNKSIEVDDQIPKIHYVVMADARRLKQIILALLDNAIKFNADGGKISLKYIFEKNAKGRKKITLEIKDSGIGMNPEDLSRVLTPFGNAEGEEGSDASAQTSLHKGQGTGLSLPLTKQLVHMMKGAFDITSELNLGTTIRITLPLIRKEE